ncbi:MAG: tryptophan-rich sensory protein [Anaerolineaceae bacterium]|nr:tryptophan-rich sensory protein [Anaerolineaceae bacterium]
MKKINPFGISNIIAIIIGYAALFYQLRKPVTERFSQLNLPSGFPTMNGLMVIWGILFLLWGIGCVFVYSIPLSPRRMRNIFLNSLILILGIFIWNYILFSAVNLPGTFALSIANLLLSVVVWFMYLVTHKYGGYLFTPVVIWQIYQLYLAIALVVKN